MEDGRERLVEVWGAFEEVHVLAFVVFAVVFAVDGEVPAEARGFLVTRGYFYEVEDGVLALSAVLVCAGAVVDDQREDGVVLEGEVGELAQVADALQAVPSQQTGSREVCGEERA